MNGANPTLSELIEAAIRSRVEQIEVSMPGVVVSYDAATQTATVQPGLRRTLQTIDGDRDAEEIPPIQNVPVIFPRSLAFSIHFNLQQGDGVHLIFTSRSTNEWRQLSLPGIATPGETRMHSVSSAVCYPGFFTDATPGPDTDESIGLPGSSFARLHFDGEHGVSAGAGASKVALADLCAIEFGKLETALSAAPGGPIPYTPASVASSNLRADP